MKMRKLFGERLRGFRIAKGYSQETLAELSGLHRTYVGGIERGERNICLDNIEKLALALEVTPGHFFKESDKQN